MWTMYSCVATFQYQRYSKTSCVCLGVRERTDKQNRENISDTQTSPDDSEWAVSLSICRAAKATTHTDKLKRSNRRGTSTGKALRTTCCSVYQVDAFTMALSFHLLQPSPAIKSGSVSLSMYADADSEHTCVQLAWAPIQSRLFPLLYTEKTPWEASRR